MNALIDKLEFGISSVLLLLLVIVVVSASAEIGYVIVTELFRPPGFFLGELDLFEIFGIFLMVLIGLELISSIRIYMEDHSIHVRAMFLISLTALTRKIVVMDAGAIDPMMLFGIAALVLALSIGVYMLKREQVES